MRSSTFIPAVMFALLGLLTMGGAQAAGIGQGAGQVSALARESGAEVTQAGWHGHHHGRYHHGRHYGWRRGHHYGWYHHGHRGHW